jgi:hypothetical protein
MDSADSPQFVTRIARKAGVPDFIWTFQPANGIRTARLTRTGLA